MSAHMAPFLDEYQSICDLILALETDEDLDRACPCGGGGLRSVRCVECCPGTLTCSTCFLAAHRNSPFHYADVWCSSRFRRQTFSSLGGVLHLGHRGDSCPSRQPDTMPSKLVVVHTNGVHTIRLHYCECSVADKHWVQLFRHRLFPASMKSPETAFSFSVLKLCHMFALCAQSSAYSMAQALRRLTNDPLVHQVPVKCNI
jgi:hypothetical protein